MMINMHAYRYRFIADAATTFPGGLIAMGANKQMLFVQYPSSLFWEPAGGIASHLNDLVSSDTTAPLISGTAFVIDPAKASISVSVTVVDTGSGINGEVSNAVLYISETPQQEDAIDINITALYNNATKTLAYEHAGEEGVRYYFWIRLFDQAGNSTDAYLGFRDSNSALVGSAATMADSTLNFSFKV